MNKSTRLSGIMRLLELGETALAADSLRDLNSQPTDEALSLLEAGLVADAHRRLECWARPKWQSEAVCRGDYRLAIAEKRARSAPVRPPPFFP